jgi:hypothetical protein
MASQNKEAVNHPAHYQQGGIEAIDVIEAWGLNFCLGNTVKYIARAGRKGEMLEDLRKAAWYLNREIKKIECLNPTSEEILAKALELESVEGARALAQNVFALVATPEVKQPRRRK